MDGSTGEDAEEGTEGGDRSLSAIVRGIGVEGLSHTFAVLSDEDRHTALTTTSEVRRQGGYRGGYLGSKEH